MRLTSSCCGDWTTSGVLQPRSHQQCQARPLPLLLARRPLASGVSSSCCTWAAHPGRTWRRRYSRLPTGVRRNSPSPRATTTSRPSSTCTTPTTCLSKRQGSPSGLALAPACVPNTVPMCNGSGRPTAPSQSTMTHRWWLKALSPPSTTPEWPDGWRLSSIPCFPCRTRTQQTTSFRSSGWPKSPFGVPARARCADRHRAPSTSSSTTQALPTPAQRTPLRAAARAGGSGCRAMWRW
mmetsp:Transcript_37975/g.122155  ORF Transcript_37975/g.122155 Transcript_37975/m.122155 type:complete len:237 (+) Transcript_37975:231-941(+)